MDYHMIGHTALIQQQQSSRTRRVFVVSPQNYGSGISLLTFFLVRLVSSTVWFQCPNPPHLLHASEVDTQSIYPSSILHLLTTCRNVRHIGPKLKTLAPAPQYQLHPVLEHEAPRLPAT